MNKNARIKELEAQLAHEGALVTDLIAGFDKTEKYTKERHAEQIESEREAHEAAFEAAALKHIRNGYIPVEELRALVVEHRKARVPGVRGGEFVTLEMNGRSTPVQKALLDALLAPEKPKLADLLRGGLINVPSPDRGSSWGASIPSIRWANDEPYAEFSPGDKVNIQTLRNGGYLVSKTAIV